MKTKAKENDESTKVKAIGDVDFKDYRLHDEISVREINKRL